MVEVKIDVSELKSEGDEIIKKLVDFLEEKTESKVKEAANEIIVGDEEKISKRYLRVILRKFLHKNGLKEYFRIIGGEEGCLKVKEKKIPAEEE